MTTDAERANLFDQGISLMNEKIGVVTSFMTAATQKYTARSKQGLFIDKIRVNGDGSIDARDPYSEAWQQIDAGTSDVTQFYRLSAMNGRQSSKSHIRFSSQIRPKYGVNDSIHRLVIDLVYAGASGAMPDPAYPNDTTKTLPITNQHLVVLWTARKITLDPSYSDIHVMQNFLCDAVHPYPAYTVGQGWFFRLRTVTSDNSATLAIKDMVAPSNFLINFNEIEIYPGV